MTDQAKRLFRGAYNIGIALLAITSVVFVFLDLGGVISLSVQPYRGIDYAILGIFTVDYITRFILAKGKWKFFKSNLFDLLAIIPFSDLFALFRFVRLFRLMKLARLTKLMKIMRLLRVVGFAGRFRDSLKRFLKTNGFQYVIISALCLIVGSSALMTYLEGGTFWDNLWWSIVTCTTVGYGDISPSTGSGRVIAIILMLFGIGLIGMLTSTLTSFFTRGAERAETNRDYGELLKAADALTPEQLEDLQRLAQLMASSSVKISVEIEDSK